jgi:hypothetical protein
MEKLMGSQFISSDEFIAWTKSLSGLLTKIRTEYGGAANMVERSDWDESKTDLALKLIKSLRVSISKVEKELAHHVAGKFG